MSIKQKNPIGFLHGNVLKLIAMLVMTIDHYAVLFHPYEEAWRIPGRIAFPIFAFFIAEGFRYTKSRIRYFLLLAVSGALFQTVYFLFTGDDMRNIFITLAISVLPLFCLDFAKRIFFDRKSNWLVKILASLPTLLSVIALYYIDYYFQPDYGFYGCLLPLFASLFRVPRGLEVPDFCQRLDIVPLRLLTLAIPLILLNFTFGGVQHFSLLALPLLAFYSGSCGKWKMKYFFYIYYPLHLVALEGLYLLLQ